MQLRQLAYFVEVIEAQSITKAAKKLYISQPSLTQTIQTFESELGFPLLNRTNRGVFPTAMGKCVYRDAKKIMESTAQMKDEWLKEYEITQKLSGTIKIASIPTSFSLVADHVIPLIKNTYPNIRCLTMEVRRFEILEYLRSDSVQLVVANVIIEDMENFMEMTQDKGIQVQNVMDDIFRVAVSPNHPAASQKELSLDDLRQESLVVYSGKDGVAEPYYKKYFDPKNIIYVSSTEKMLHMVVSGYGVAVFPSKIMMRSNYNFISNKIRFINVPEINVPIIHYIAWKKDCLSPEISRIKDCITDIFSSIQK